ncbi:type V toxin-antitoxin system endoribonuclease antitoxin GhoS [Erwinia sp. BNK-24-b]|uniref:type V toxin-antitoxin system endoribonuclease antitoxin GhoS n=1 Tax=Erwinia TaxID=551 RepID=UPI001FEEF78C|nr:type V toxin-antitoxin system endoribonuclease antitoxin GhoS [Erwinia phyllosphaerae]MBV4366486.1 type V toxin-antitoxin system endoribonuclease antitoxin GhoS [Erwinia phyllosphaerae]
MVSSDIEQYVVTFRFKEESLADALELNSALANGGFTTSLNDKDGHPHELGTNSFGIVSALTQEEIREQAISLGEIVLGEKPEVEIQTWKTFQAEAAR